MSTLFANSALEEQMILGKSKNDVIAASFRCLSGTVEKPINPTETLIQCVSDSSDDEMSEIYNFVLALIADKKS